MNKFVKIIVAVSLTIAVLAIAISVISFFVLNSKLPEYDATVTVSGINNNVKIFRDENAIPFIIAEDETDAIFALGYVHAQERLFQMDLSRRAGEGRLSEIMGEKTLPYDKMFRTLGLMKLAEETYPKLNSLSKKYLEAYAKGVNAYIQKAEGNFTFEFDVLGYTPEKWKPVHSLLLSKLMAWELNISWWTDIAFSDLVQKLGKEEVEKLLPDFDENAPTIIPQKLKNSASVTSDFYKVDKSFRDFMGFTGTHIGSNNWVVNKRKSATGSVIIANDPHLSFQAPGKFYFSVIRSNKLNAEGFSIPGMPAFIIGKNQNIAWVLTNVMADDSDFYIEKLDSSNTRYRVNNEWRSLEVFKDTVFIKDSKPIVFTIKKTHRGPIISDIHLFKESNHKENIKRANLSMRWTALDFSDEIFAMISINKSKNWNDFKKGVSNFTAPGQNFVYGDKFGNIGYICGAKLPIRKINSPTLVFDGTTDEYDWTGFVPFNKMPMLFNPAMNFIASANNKTVMNFKYHISNLWEPASRIERITELLQGKAKHTVKDFKKYQNDFYSHYAEDVTPFILRAFSETKINDDNLKTAIRLLSQWDFIMDKNSQTPTIFNVFLQKLMKNIFMDEMGERLFNEYIFIANVPYRKIKELLDDENNIWWDNVATEDIENRNTIIRKSLVDALALLEKRFSKDMVMWQWMKLHTLTFKHPFSSASPLLSRVLDIGPFTVSGDGTTIFNTEYSFTNPYENKLGPALRFIYDFSNPDTVNIILPTGESGYFMSKHYNDMTDKWLNGDYLKIDINTTSIENKGFDLLQLVRE